MLLTDSQTDKQTNAAEKHIVTALSEIITERENSETYIKLLLAY